MRRFLVYFVFLITCFVLQGTLFRSIDFGSVTPNLMLICVVSFSLMRGEKTGIIMGFFAGLLLDIFCGSLIGFYALLFMYLGFFAGSFNRLFFAEDIKLPLVLIVVSDAAYNLLCYVFLFLLRGRLDLPYYFKNIFVPEAVYTVIVTIVVYPICLFLNRLLENGERKRAQKLV